MENRVAVLKTLLYSDIFDYPLTKEEIWRHLVASKKTNLRSVELELARNKHVHHRDGFYFLRGRQSIVSLRKKREKISLIKLKKAKEIIKKLFYIPTIELIGISGNLSLKNSEKKDDIDLFIVAKKNTIWLTRILIIVVLLFLKVYRKRGNRNIKDKICTNMFLDAGHLRFSKKRQNLFIAHELMQFLPIAERGNVYTKLIKSNKWILNYLSNSFSKMQHCIIKNRKNSRKTGVVLRSINYIVKIPQIMYMKNHITTEEISDTILAFHPRDHRNYILKKYKKQLQKYNL